MTVPPGRDARPPATSDAEPIAFPDLADEPTAYAAFVTVDAEVARLEDVLLAYPYDRALPSLEAILADAGVRPDLLAADERALKVLHEAVVARPLADLDEAAALRSEIELLTVETRVLTDRLRSTATGRPEIDRAQARLLRIRRRLDEVRRLL